MKTSEILIISGCVLMLVVLFAFIPCEGINQGFLGQYTAAPIVSYYQKYGGDDTDKIVVGLHYTSWCGYCKLMKPVWDQVKQSCQDMDMNIQFIENDEDQNPNTFIKGYPTIIRLYHGRISQYMGPANYQQLMEFCLNTSRETWY